MIEDIAEFLGIACFMVKKRDKAGGGMCLGMGRGCNDGMAVDGRCNVCMYAYLVVGPKSLVYSTLWF